MKKPVIQLYPTGGEEQSLEGLYLQHNLHQRGSAQRPFVYTNFVSSLDGRIGMPAQDATSHQVPPAIANSRDWRLFQELAGQADALITTARYFRQLDAGEAQDNLPVGADGDYADIRQWREKHGLSPQPAVALVSSSLDFPLSALTPYRERSIFVVTGKTANPEKIQALEKHGIPVLLAGSGGRVEGKQLVQCLAKQGFYNQYAIGGPKIMATLASAGALDRLYLTVAHRLLGGAEFDTFVWGDSFDPAVNLSMQYLYYDSHAPAHSGQWLSVFDVNKNK